MPEKIRILHIIKSLGRGGAEMLLPETLKYHNKEYFEFHYVYFLPWKDQMVEEIKKNGGKVFCLPSSNNISLILKYSALIKYIKENNIRLLHCHLPWAGILGRIVGQRTGIPVIYTEHNKQERYHFGTRFLNLMSMNLLTRVIAVSTDVAESIARNKPTLQIPIETIVNGVDVGKFDRIRFEGSDIRKKLGVPANALIIGTISVFRFQKRLDLWIELAAKIVRQHENAHFVIVGDGPLKNELLSKRAALGLDDRIHMPGLQTQVGPYLGCFDIFMMTSIYEGLPIALLEAMSMQVPVIATAAGGIKEVIRHEIDGLVCDVSEPEKLVDFAIQLLSDSSRRKEFGSMARQRVKESFSMDRMVERLEGVYKEQLSNRSPSD